MGGKIDKKTGGCKPGSVRFHVAVISLEPPLPAASSNLPEINASNVIISVWSCIKWGLHCRFCCQKRGELLPRHFTLTG